MVNTVFLRGIRGNRSVSVKHRYDGKLFACLFFAGVTGAIAASPAAFGFVFSIGIMLFAAGLFLFLFMTWFLKLSWRRADL